MWGGGVGVPAVDAVAVWLGAASPEGVVALLPTCGREGGAGMPVGGVGMVFVVWLSRPGAGVVLPSCGRGGRAGVVCWRWTVGAGLVLVLVLVWGRAGVWGGGVGVPVGGVGPAVDVVRFGAVSPVGVVWPSRPGAGVALPVGDVVAALVACVRRGAWAGVVGV